MIIPNYFHNKEDLIPILEGFKFGKKFAAAFGDGSVYENGPFPGCSDYNKSKYTVPKKIANVSHIKKRT